MSTRYSLLIQVARRTSLAILTCALLSAILTRQAAASGPDETAFDAAALGQMELRADHAVPHDQCYLYTELIHGLTELAGRQIAAGQDDDAAATMRQVDVVATKIQTASGKDAKRLKNAEQLLEHTSHRLADMVRVASNEQRTLLQSTLQHLNSVHTGVLAMVFAH
jgi:hypothetical protein